MRHWRKALQFPVVYVVSGGVLYLFADPSLVIADKHGVLLVPVVLAGDGNLHYFIIKLDETPDEDWPDLMDAALSDLIDVSLEMGGTVSGEHGVGYTKKRYLEREVGSAQVRLMKGVKTVFDPNGILNPCKVWP